MTQDNLIGGCEIGFLNLRAKEIVEEKTVNSKIFDLDAEAAMPRFERNELQLGNVLGKGGFCTVNEIKKVIPNDGSTQAHVVEEDDDEFGADFTPGNITQDRNYIIKRYRRGKDARYAIKKLSDDIDHDPQHYVAGVIDLAIESRFLAVVRHPNIIKMRACANISPYERGFFVILDRLYDTLTDRLKIWKAKKKKNAGLSKFRDLSGAKKKKAWLERLIVGYDIAAALRFLHGQNIIYRDLKPDNIGFDVRGDVKIFDFGLAREVDSEILSDDVYQLSGRTGSLRYMAPEVANFEPYNFSVDVFSFGILLWQICSLETPFPGFDVEMHAERVVKNGERPKIDPKWSSSLSSFLRKSWHPDYRNRPDFEQVSDTLRNEISALRSEKGSVLDVSSRTDNSN